MSYRNVNIYQTSGDVTTSIEVGDNGVIMQTLKNNAAEFSYRVGGAGSFSIYNDTNGGDPIIEIGSSATKRAIDIGNAAVNINNDYENLDFRIRKNTSLETAYIYDAGNDTHLFDGTALSAIVNEMIVSGDMRFVDGTSINEFSTDGTLAGNSDDAVPTEQAVKTYADNLTSLGGLTTTDNALVKANGTGGQLQNTGATLDDNNNLSLRSIYLEDRRIYRSGGAGHFHFEGGLIPDSESNNRDLGYDATQFRWRNLYLANQFNMNNGAATIDSTGNIVGASLQGASGTSINEFSIDGTMAGNSDDAVPTEKAVKTYVDTSISDLTVNDKTSGSHTLVDADAGLGTVVDDPFTIPNGLTIGKQFFIYNASSSAVAMTFGGSVTIEGESGTSLSAYGMITLWVRASNVIVMKGETE